MNEYYNYAKTLRVTLENIGEGYGGDYDPNDPEDRPLLRFYVYIHNPLYSIDNGTEEWLEVDDASYCTLLSATLDDNKKEKAARKILGMIESCIDNGESLKKCCEMISWIDDKNLESTMLKCPKCGAVEEHPTDRDKIVIRGFKIADTSGYWWSQCLRCSGYYSQDLKTHDEKNHDKEKGWF